MRNPRTRAARTGFLYVIGPVDGPYKIGWASDPRDRLRYIQNGNHLPLRLWTSWRVTHPAAREGWLHEHLADRRIRGEWFAGPLGDIIAAIETAVAMSVDDKRAYRAPSPEARVFANQALVPVDLGPVEALDLASDQVPRREDFAGAFSQATLRAYRADWRDWQAFAAAQGAAEFPAAPDVVRAWIVALAAAGKKYATIDRKISALQSVHRWRGVAFDRRMPVIQFALRRIAREIGTARSGRSEIMTDQLVAMLATLRHDYRGKRDRALLLLDFAAGLRRSEIVALEVNDIEWRRDGILLNIRRSKGDQEGAGQIVGVEYGAHPPTCPVRALKAWLAASTITSGRIFPLHPYHVTRLVKACVEAIGLDPRSYASHSTRVGHVTQALANGADPVKVQQQLRHKKLETTLGYNRRRQFENNSSGKLGL